MRYIAKRRIWHAPSDRIIEIGELMPEISSRAARLLLNGGFIRVEKAAAVQDAPSPEVEGYPEIGIASSGEPRALTDVPGIGPERARGLAQMGITTWADLLDADPQEVEAQMVNVSVAMVERWQGYCRVEEFSEMNSDEENGTDDGERTTQAPCAHCRN